jgi:hypothetical protein
VTSMSSMLGRAGVAPVASSSGASIPYVTPREKLLERIGNMSDTEVEALYSQVPPAGRLSHEEFEEALDELGKLAERLNLDDVDVTALIREDRDSDRWS